MAIELVSSQYLGATSPMGFHHSASVIDLSMNQPRIFEMMLKLHVRKTSSISEEAKERLLKLAQQWGVSSSVVIELVMRRVAKREKVR